MAAVITDIVRNEREIIRIEVSEFKDRELINLRIWYRAFDDNGNEVYKPTQKGVALDITKFDDLKKAVDKIGEYISDRQKGYAPPE